jgi:hypothetical protein
MAHSRTLFLIASVVLLIYFVAVKAEYATRKRSELHGYSASENTRRGRQLNNRLPWQTIGEAAGTLLANHFSDNMHRSVRRLLDAGSDVLRTTEQYLDVADSLIASASLLAESVANGDDRIARQLFTSEEGQRIMAAISNTYPEAMLIFSSLQLVQDFSGPGTNRQGERHNRSL